jgi:soluble lytic murein transglycosylase-like protein
MRTFWLLPLVCLATAQPAFGQIYTWRDDAGHLVLSNQPRTGAVEVPTYAVPGRSMMRTTTGPDKSSARVQYDDLIEHHAANHGLSADLVRAVIQAESGFNPHAVSPKGAIGLMQLMPVTARELGVTDPFRPDDNIRGGVLYLAQLMARFDQNLELALAAYNAGPGNVERYGAVPPFRETRAYVRKINGALSPTEPPGPRGPLIYKWVEVVDGKARTRYSNIPPGNAVYEILGQR